MNLISLYYFVELAKELHVTNTAQKLYISQQNLTQHIQRLEQHYGVVLFHRKPKLALTYAGEQLLASAQKILAEETQLVNRLSSISENNRGTLKVGIPAYRAQVCLPEILPEFYKKWPNVKIDLVNESSGKMEDMVFSGELDFFIGIMYQDSPKLHIETILNDRIYLVCSDALMKKYLPDSWNDLKQTSVSGADLEQFCSLPFLLPEASMRLRKTIDQCFQKARITPNIFLESSTTELLISLYPHDFGAFFCTQMRLPQLLEMYPDANAFPLRLQDGIVQHRLVLAYHRDRFLPPYAHDFIALTEQTFQRISQVRPQNLSR